MPKETPKLINEKIKQISYNIRTNDIRFGEHGHKRERVDSESNIVVLAS